MGNGKNEAAHQQASSSFEAAEELVATIGISIALEVADELVKRIQVGAAADDTQNPVERLLAVEKGHDRLTCRSRACHPSKVIHEHHADESSCFIQCPILVQSAKRV